MRIFTRNVEKDMPTHLKDDNALININQFYVLKIQFLTVCRPQQNMS